MTPSPKPVMERALAFSLLSLLLGLVWLEVRSRTASPLRSGPIASAWLALRAPDAGAAQPPALYLLVYSFRRGVLDIIHLPSPAAEQEYRNALRRSGDAATRSTSAVRAMIQAQAGVPAPLREAPFLDWSLSSAAGDPKSPEAVKDWLLSWPRDARFFPALRRTLPILRRRAVEVPTAYDLFLLALEAYRLRADAVRARRLVPAYLSTLLPDLLAGRAPPPPTGPTTIEVLNASGEDGVALSARKVLISSGLDVIYFGNAPELLESTRVVDRSGRYDAALEVADALQCAPSGASSQPEETLGIQVTLLLGKDWRRCGRLAVAPEAPEGTRTWNW